MKGTDPDTFGTKSHNLIHSFPVLETDIMLIDEVLSVGDAKFKKKSYKKMQELIMDENRTVVIVSHSTETLEKLCTSLLWLHEGEIKMQGDTKNVLDAYNEFMA